MALLAFLGFMSTFISSALKKKREGMNFVTAAAAQHGVSRGGGPGTPPQTRCFNWWRRTHWDRLGHIFVFRRKNMPSETQSWPLCWCVFVVSGAQ